MTNSLLSKIKLKINKTSEVIKEIYSPIDPHIDFNNDKCIGKVAIFYFYFILSKL